MWYGLASTAMTDQPLLTRDFVLLIAAHLLQALGYSSLLLFPVYLDHLGASRAELGTIMATAALSGLIFRPLIAWALDSLGRKPTVLIGTAVLTVGMMLIGWVDDLGAVVYIDRILVGIGVAALFTGYFTWASDLIPVARRTEGLAIFGASGLLPIGLNAFAHEFVFDPSSLRDFFPVIGGLIAMSFLFVAAIPEPSTARTRPDPRDESTEHRLRDVIRALCRAPLLPVWLATFVFSALVALFLTFATVTAESRLLTVLQSGSHAPGFLTQPASLWLPYALAALSVRLLGSRFPDRIGTHNMVAPALALYVSAFLTMAVAEQPTSLLIAGALAGLGHGYCFPVLISQVVSRSPERWRGSAIALYTAIWGLANLVLVPFFGGVADRHGDPALYGAASLGALGCISMWCVLEHRWGHAISPEKESRC